MKFNNKKAIHIDLRQNGLRLYNVIELSIFYCSNIIRNGIGHKL